MNAFQRKTRSMHTLVNLQTNIYRLHNFLSKRFEMIEFRTNKSAHLKL
ncbi:hypothetical protein BH11BAC2_BH11BAC2_19970 [soil metagenome]